MERLIKKSRESVALVWAKILLWLAEWDREDRKRPGGQSSVLIGM
jgi:hypothetical protein